MVAFGQNINNATYNVGSSIRNTEHARSIQSPPPAAATTGSVAKVMIQEKTNAISPSVCHVYFNHRVSL